MNTSKLLLIRGLPGSGKSTESRRLLDSGEYDCHFEADQYFMTDGEYRFDASKIALAHRYCENSTVSALRMGKRVVVSNTFTTAREVRPYRAMAEELQIPIELRTMTGQWGSIHDVPAETIARMRTRFQEHV